MNEHVARKNDLSPRWLYLAWLSLAFTTLVVGVIGAAVQGNPEPVVLRWGIVSDFAIFAIGLHAVGMLAAVALLYALLKRDGSSWRATGLKGRLSLTATGYVLAGVLVASLLYPLAEILLGAVGVSMYWEGPRGSHLHLESAFDVILALAGPVLIIPAAEEIIFRGYILTMLTERKLKTAIAVALSALIFASIHVFFGPGMLVYIFVWAFIPAFLYLKFESLYPAILFHLLNNLIAYVILPLVGV